MHWINQINKKIDRRIFGLGNPKGVGRPTNSSKGLFDFISFRDQEIIRMLLSGDTPTEIARSLGIKSHTVWRIKAKPQVQRELAELSKKIDDKLVDNIAAKVKSDPIKEEMGKIALASVKLLHEIVVQGKDRAITDASAKDIITAALTTLKMAGYSKDEVINNTIVNNIDLKEVTQALKDIKDGSNTEFRFNRGVKRESENFSLLSP